MNRGVLINLLWALVLLALGVIGLLYNFGALDAYKSMAVTIAAAALAIAGVLFLVSMVFMQDRWLFVVPAISLLTLASIVYLASLGTVAGEWLGALFLGGIAAGFLVLFLSNRRERWWALLQAGTIGVIAIVGLGVGVPEARLPLLGAALFGGFGLSFLLVFLFGGDFRRFLWAAVMALVLFIFAMSIIAAGVQDRMWLVRIWPSVLVILGLVLFFRVLTGRSSPKPALPAQPVYKYQPDEAAAPVGNAEPARILRADQPAQSAPPAVEPLPAELTDIDPNDAGAALDALLDASSKP